MCALDKGEVVGGLVALLDALHERKRLTPKECEARNIHRHVASPSTSREAVEQAAASILEAKFVDLVVANGPLILGRDAPIVVVLVGGAGKSVLTEILRTLSLYLDASHIAGANTPAQHQPVTRR